MFTGVKNWLRPANAQVAYLPG